MNKPRLDIRNVTSAIRLVWQASPALFLASLAVSIVGGLLPVASAVVNARIVEVVASGLMSPGAGSPLNDLRAQLLWFAAIVMGTQLVVRGTATIQQALQIRSSQHVQRLLVEKAMSVDLEAYEDATFYNQFRNASVEAAFRPHNIVNLLVGALTALVTLASLCYMLLAWRVWLPPVILLVAVVVFWINAKFGQQTVALKSQQTVAERRCQYLKMLLTGDAFAKEIRLGGLGDYFKNRLNLEWKQLYDEEWRLAVRKMFALGGVGAMSALVQPAVIWYIAVECLKNSISLGGFTLYTQLAVGVQSAADRLMVAFSQLYENTLFMANLTGFMALKPSVEARRPARAAIQTSLPKIEFRGVSFQYPKTNRMILSDLSFEIFPGEIVALVGENGAGKSTIVKLLSGLYEPSAGKILLGGVDITSMDRADLRRQLSVILQDFPVYHLSAHENIGVGDISRVDDIQAIEAAARLSGFDKVVKDMPDQYDTILGRSFEKGHELSGGQKQLVALTRALFRKASILILDEPTAALDSRKERQFYELVVAAATAGQKSILLISHRLASVKRASRIIYLENGKATEVGTHHDLMVRGGAYSKLYNEHAQSELSPTTQSRGT